MSRMRSGMSKKNKYWIPNERYLELKHFCLQYDDWWKECMSTLYHSKGHSIIQISKDCKIFDPTSEAAINARKYVQKIELIHHCAEQANFDIWKWIVQGVTEDLGYEALKMRGIPCGKDYYYESYHKFFYILDKARK